MKYDAEETPKVVYEQMIKGRTISHICEKVLRVERSTFYGGQKDPDSPEFEGAVDNAKKAISDEMDAALLKLAKGGSHTEVTRELVDGQMRITKKVTKKYQPDLNAIKYYKNNTDPARWADKKQVEHTGEVDVCHTIPAEVKEILNEVNDDETAV